MRKAVGSLVDVGSQWFSENMCGFGMTSHDFAWKISLKSKQKFLDHLKRGNGQSILSVFSNNRRWITKIFSKIN
jgi:hypothetical protein